MTSIIDMTDSEHRAFLRRLRTDLKTAAATMSREEGRYLVDLYYQRQEDRKRGANQTRAADEGSEPNALVAWLAEEFAAIENTIKACMDAYTDRHAVTQWAKSLYGVGPVLAAGIYVHTDITKAPTAGSLWRFAGLDPSVTWEKKKKRPWNARLKVLAWKFADCQKKFSGREECFYGALYQTYKAKLVERNEAGEFAEAAAAGLAKVGKATEAAKAYAKGKLPPGHLDARAMRWVAKLFLSHWHEVHYTTERGERPPKPYSIEHMGHAHKIEVPGWVAPV